MTSRVYSFGTLVLRQMIAPCKKVHKFFFPEISSDLCDRTETAARLDFRRSLVSGKRLPGDRVYPLAFMQLHLRRPVDRSNISVGRGHCLDLPSATRDNPRLMVTFIS